MTVKEFSDAFATLANSHARKAMRGDQASFQDVVLDEYEKSVFLTKSQEAIVIELYNGKNPFGDSFEDTEEIRRYLDKLVETSIIDMNKRDVDKAVSKDSVFIDLPSNLLFITLEQAIFEDGAWDCYEDGERVNVYPVTQDEYNRIRHNPFRGATKRRVLRLDSGDVGGKRTIELVSKYPVDKYIVRYLRKPQPIILTDLGHDNLEVGGESKESGCELPEILHNAILDRAVGMALSAKGVFIKE